MKTFTKVCLIIISLLGFVSSLFVFVFILNRGKEGIAAYALVMAVLFVILFIYTVFSTRRSNYMVIKQPGGEIQISKHTIESVVRYSFTDVDTIISSSIWVKTTKAPEKTKVYIRLNISDKSGVVPFTQNIKERVEYGLLAATGVPINYITLRVVEFDPNKKPKKTAASDPPRRVI